MPRFVSRPWTRGLLAAIGAVGLLIAGSRIGMACAVPPDANAYYWTDRGIEAFDRFYGFTPPACELRGFRYGASLDDAERDELAVTFTAGRPCVDGFLASVDAGRSVNTLGPHAIEFGFGEVDWPGTPVIEPDEHVRFELAGTLEGDWFGHVLWRENEATLYLSATYRDHRAS